MSENYVFIHHIFSGFPENCKYCSSNIKNILNKDKITWETKSHKIHLINL